jgi:hypothetical protein
MFTSEASVGSPPVCESITSTRLIISSNYHKPRETDKLRWFLIRVHP